jgi:beta-galactosidase
MVIVPAMNIVNEQRAEVLTQYAQRGRLVLTARTGMKDDFNAMHPMRPPGLLAELAGIEVEEYFSLDQPVPVKGKWFEGVSQQWAEQLNIINEKATVIAHYGPSNGWLDDQAAITVCSTTKGVNGLVYYVGAYLDEVTQLAMMRRIVQYATISSPPIKVPDGVEIRPMTNAAKQNLWLVINHQQTGKIINPPWPVVEHLSGKTLEGKFKVAPYGVAILTKAA